jgi:hypothetical protein
LIALNVFPACSLPVPCMSHECVPYLFPAHALNVFPASFLHPPWILPSSSLHPSCTLPDRFPDAPSVTGSLMRNIVYNIYYSVIYLDEQWGHLPGRLKRQIQQIVHLVPPPFPPLPKYEHRRRGPQGKPDPLPPPPNPLVSSILCLYTVNTLLIHC